MSHPDSAFLAAHYSLATQPDKLRAWATRVVSDLPSDITPLFCGRGISGIAHVTAVALQYPKPFAMALVRKNGEFAHSSRQVEWGRHKDALSPFTLVFVDDLIDTGHTREQVLREVVNDTHDPSLRFTITVYSALLSHLSRSPIRSNRIFELFTEEVLCMDKFV